MAITYAIDFANTGRATSATSGTLTLASGDVITAVVSLEANIAGPYTISNSGSALTWNSIGATASVTDSHIVGWWASVPDSTSRTVTVSWSEAQDSTLNCIVHSGAHATTPVPSGNVYSGVTGTDVSQSITPTASGSALWMFAADWNATNTFAAAANCTLFSAHHDASYMTATGIRPTTQPRTDANAFTIGETDTSGKIAWLAFEVQAADSGPSFTPRGMLLGVG